MKVPFFIAPDHFGYFTPIYCYLVCFYFFIDYTLKSQSVPATGTFLAFCTCYRYTCGVEETTFPSSFRIVAKVKSLCADWGIGSDKLYQLLEVMESVDF